MSWSYGGDPRSGADMIRFLVGDTDESDPQLQDGEVAALFATHADETLAAAHAARALSAKYARQVDYRNMSLAVSSSQRAKAYGELAAKLFREAAAAAGAKVLFPAGDVAWKEAQKLDDGQVQPSFSRGMDDNPRNVNSGDDAGQLVRDR